MQSWNIYNLFQWRKSNNVENPKYHKLPEILQIFSFFSANYFFISSMIISILLQCFFTKSKIRSIKMLDLLISEENKYYCELWMQVFHLFYFFLHPSQQKIGRRGMKKTGLFFGGWFPLTWFFLRSFQVWVWMTRLYMSTMLSWAYSRGSCHVAWSIICLYNWSPRNMIKELPRTSYSTLFDGGVVEGWLWRTLWWVGVGSRCYYLRLRVKLPLIYSNAI